MTNEEAIYLLRNTAWLAPTLEPIDEAIEMACEALRKADTPQTDYPCNTCANKGDHDGECKNCVAESAPIRWETPSHYKPKQTDCPWK